MPREVWYWTDPNGTAYTLNDNVYTFLRTVDGADGPNADIGGDRYPYQHGETFRAGSIYAPPIDVSLLIDVMCDTRLGVVQYMDTYLRNISPFKSQDALGVLTRRWPDGTTLRALDCSLASRRMEHSGPVTGGLYLRFHGKFPFWYDPAEHVETFGLFGPAGITFPVTFPITFGVDDIDDTTEIQNPGDIPIWPIIKFYGPGTDPTVDNDTTGKVMEITQTLDAGDYIEIDMKEADVWFFDYSEDTLERINDAISAGSEFWQLQPGANEIHVTMADTTSGTIELRYFVYYLKA